MDLLFTFPLAAGLHARPASLMKEEAGKFSSSVTFVNRSRNASADVRSTLALVSTLTTRGDECLLTIEGPDAEGAGTALRTFIDRVLPHVDDGAPQVQAARSDATVRPRPLRGAPSLNGLGVSPGIGHGPVFVVGRSRVRQTLQRSSPAAPDHEVARFAQASGKVKAEIESQLLANPSRVAAAVLRVHASIVEDPAFGAKVTERICSEKVTAEEAVWAIADDYARTLRRSESTYLQERAFDVQDVADRILDVLAGASIQSPLPPGPPEGSVWVAERLTPADLVALGRTKVAALILRRGETTSHVVILARAAGIPCLSGVRGAEHLISGQDLLVDAYRGLAFPVPGNGVRDFYQAEGWLREERSERMLRDANLPAVSRDGVRVEIGSNCASPVEVSTAVAHGAEGIGVFRTEIAFAGSAIAPSEEEQYSVYRSVVERAKGRPVIFRTFDVGGDKPVRWLPVPPEDNPFLGYRAVRMYDEFTDVIDAQCKAILRAAALGPTLLMFPMIASPEELRHLRKRLDRCIMELSRDGVVHSPAIPVGMMVEVPSAVLLIDQCCPLVDFFSIGSNDLTQYLVAADRGNEKVRHLCSGIHPALLRSFERVIDVAHAQGKWVGLCGELAGEEDALPVLLGLGFDELSIGPMAVPKMKARLRTLRKSDCVPLARTALDAPTPSDVAALLRGFATREDAAGIIEKELVTLTSRATTKDEILREILGLLEDAGRINDLDAVAEALWQREESFSTGMEYGFALPHCKSPHVLVPSIAVGRTVRPVPWGGENCAVSVVIAIVIPENSTADTHLRIIAALARKLMHEEYRDVLLHAESPEQIVRHILPDARGSGGSGA